MEWSALEQVALKAPATLRQIANVQAVAHRLRPSEVGRMASLTQTQAAVLAAQGLECATLTTVPIASFGANRPSIFATASARLFRIFNMRFCRTRSNSWRLATLRFTGPRREPK